MKISIPQPCHENWNEMLPEEKGRFCQSCQKCVTDFTKLTDDEILNYSEKNVCVKLSKNQIGRINSSTISSFPKWLKYSSWVLLLGFGKYTFAQNQKELKFTTSEIEELIKKDTLISIKLKLVDDFDESPIPNAKVYLNKKKKKYSTTTDENGYFELEIPSKYLDDYLIIEDEYYKRDYQIRYIINQEKVGNEIILGLIEYKKSNSFGLISEKVIKFLS